MVADTSVKRTLFVCLALFAWSCGNESPETPTAAVVDIPTVDLPTVDKTTVPPLELPDAPDLIIGLTAISVPESDGEGPESRSSVAPQVGNAFRDPRERRKQERLLPDIDQSSTVYALGVYEASPRDEPRDFRQHPQGKIDVTVGEGSSKLILVLSAYEPVEWRLTGAHLDRVTDVILLGYHQQDVTGLSASVRVTKTRENKEKYCNEFAYVKNDKRYSRLQECILSITGKSISQFQGDYQKSAFSVGGNRTVYREVDPDASRNERLPPGTILKWVDENGVTHYGDPIPARY